ncbi:MAG TPA: hypothetical protein VGM44_13385 [Polyangiaceae bacterium]
MIALWTLAGLELLYLIAANLFLNLNLLPLAFASTNQIKATVASGWTIVPGHVHANRVRVTFQDHNLQFSIDVAHASLTLHLTELVHHRFHASHLRGDGVAFHLRHRVDPWSKNQPAIGTFAPFPEFPGPAVFEAFVREPPIPDDKYNLWIVHLDDVDVGVSEAWVQAFRFRGKGRARGQFQLKPARTLWVGPASLELEPGSLTAGAYRVASGLAGRIDCVVHPFDVRVPVGMAVFRYISVHIRLSAPELDPRVVGLFTNEPRVSSAGGSLNVDLETRHGVLTRESHAEIVQRGVELRTPEFELNAERVELGVQMPGASDSAVTLRVSQAVLQESAALGFAPKIVEFSGAIVSANRDVARDFGFKEVHVDDARMALTDSHWLNYWLAPRGFELAGGSAALHAHARYADSKLDGAAALDTEGLNAALGSKQIHYRGAVAVELSRADPKALTGALHATVQGRDLSAALGKGTFKVAGLDANVFASRDGESSELRAEALVSSLSSVSPDFRMHAPTLAARALSEQHADGTELTHFSASIPAFFAEGRGARLTSGAQIRGTLAHQRKQKKQLDFAATLFAPKARFGAEPVKAAETPRVEVRGALSSDTSGALSGKLALLPAAWRVDAANLRLSGKSALELELRALNLGAHSGTVAANFSSSGVTLGDTTQNANCAWSRVESVELAGSAELLPRGATSLAMHGELGQTQLSWGDFTTHADLGLAAKFDAGLFAQDGGGKLDLSLRHATIQSGLGGKNGWSANVPEISVVARVARKSGKLSALAEVSAERAAARIGATALETDLDAKLDLDRLDLNARTAHATGDVRIRHASLPNAPEPVKDWWADVHLDSLHGHAEQNLELGGMFRARLRDATPALAVLANRGSLPKWVPSAFPLRDFSITGSIARRCRLTDIRLVELSGGPALARGRLQSLPDGFQGALLLRLAGFQAISAGLEFDSEHTHVGLFDGDDWLARYEHFFDRKAENATKLACPPDPEKCMASEDDGVSASAGDATSVARARGE